MQRYLWILVAALMCACGVDSSGLSTTSPPAQGTEGGPCFGNDTCYDQLVCLSEVCVDPGSGGAAGQSAGGSGGPWPDAGSGGAAGQDGAAAGGGGSGGASGQGGAAGGQQAGAAGQGATAGASGGDGGPGGQTGGTGGEDAGVDAAGGIGGTGSGGTGGTGGADAGGSGGAAGSTAVIMMPQGFGIDATEVSRAQYAAWLATTPTTTGQINACKNWNFTFAPDPTCVASVTACSTYCEDRPQTCVDWCDATAYCKAHGKRLCGDIAGGSLYYGHFIHLTFSQWFVACTSHGEYDYPYGDTFNWQTCATGWGSQGPEPVGTTEGCQSPLPGYAGVFDLSGNVREWEDACTAPVGPDDDCRVRGGGYLSDQAIHARCDADMSFDRDTADRFVGFRCCTL